MWLNRPQLVGESVRDVHDPLPHPWRSHRFSFGVPPWGLPIEGNNGKYALTHSEISSLFVYISLLSSRLNFKPNSRSLY